MENATPEVLMVRSEPTADASLAAIFERSKFGIAIAAIIKIMATTINSSINEKPFCCFLIVSFPPTRFFGSVESKRQTSDMQCSCQNRKAREIHVPKWYKTQIIQPLELP